MGAKDKTVFLVDWLAWNVDAADGHESEGGNVKQAGRVQAEPKLSLSHNKMHWHWHCQRKERSDGRQGEGKLNTVETATAERLRYVLESSRSRVGMFAKTVGWPVTCCDLLCTCFFCAGYPRVLNIFLHCRHVSMLSSVQTGQ